MEEGGEEEEQEEDISELDEEERAEYQALNRQLDQLDKVTSGLKITVSYHSLALFQRFLKSIFFLVLNPCLPGFGSGSVTNFHILDPDSYQNDTDTAR